uniref:Uncharacterized protein n=1 Tax=Oryza nivara TaxID=4536 RepID=A0A0E0HK47_ORYNI
MAANFGGEFPVDGQPGEPCQPGELVAAAVVAATTVEAPADGTETPMVSVATAGTVAVARATVAMGTVAPIVSVAAAGTVAVAGATVAMAGKATAVAMAGTMRKAEKEAAKGTAEKAGHNICQLCPRMRRTHRAANSREQRTQAMTHTLRLQIVVDTHDRSTMATHAHTAFLSMSQ